MRFLQDITNELQGYQKLKSLCKVDGAVVVNGLAAVHKAHMIHSLCADTKRRAFVVVSDEPELRRLSNDLASMGSRAVSLPYRDLNLRDFEGSSGEYEHRRIVALSNISDGEYDMVISTFDAALQYTIPKSVLHENTVKLKLGEDIAPDKLKEKLIVCGYEACSMVEGEGQFSQRGDILDVFSPNHSLPLRIEFFGDSIESISLFDTENQRRKQSLKEADILPIKEVIIGDPNKLKRIEGTTGSLDKYIGIAYDERATLLSYLGRDDIVFVSEELKSKREFKENDAERKQAIKRLVEQGNLDNKNRKFNQALSFFDKWVSGRLVVYLDNFITGHTAQPKDIININAQTLPLWNGSVKALKEEIEHSAREGSYKCVVLGGSTVFSENVYKALGDNESVSFEKDPKQLRAGGTIITTGALSGGIYYPETGARVISHGYAESAKFKDKPRRIKGQKSITGLEQLNIGDYVVHTLHGIGKFNGVKTIRMQGVVKDYVKISYSGEDVLYVPVTQLDMVAKYIGSKEGAKIKLNKIGSREWANTKKRAKLKAKDIAKDLIKIYSKRLKSQGYAFPEDTQWQKDFEAGFEFEETHAQLKCSEEIKQDMQKGHPMDRLLCGDVGFGKTEVALRAAFKCVTAGKQCAILVPTTILAWQHYNTVSDRFKDFPVSVEMISRFRTKKEQKEIIQKVRQGQTDILIGTHRIVQDDIKFRDLGLVIVDEEQRFGVLQKEKLKNMAAQTDILTMTATPIPRTLNMALSGIRDMSSLEEPPQDRYPVQTYVLEYSQPVINEAIEREIQRNGQVYFLHNRIDSINSIAYRLQREIPGAKVGVSHSKMSEEELSSVWRRLVDGEINVLVCTTIIESGIDVPNVNTLIVDNADHMGLSQLYQLRGRVGRSTRRAYAYLTFRKDKMLSEIAMKRLNAIKDFTEFGSGFKISMRDLELRGAGNILGGEQHGHMEAVGYDMYIKLLSEAVEEEKGIRTGATPEQDCLIDIQMRAHIPESYISDLNLRLSIYRKIADIRGKEDAQSILGELRDRFGKVPTPVTDLVEVAEIRVIASKLSIYEIKQNNDMLFFNMKQTDMKRIASLVGGMGRKVMFNAGAKPYISIKTAGEKPALETVREAIFLLNK